MNTRCGHCGKDPAEGLATVDDVRYCHGDWQESPTCYESAGQDWRKLDPDPAVALLKAMLPNIAQRLIRDQEE